VIGIAFSPDGRRLLTAGQDGAVRQWQSATGTALSHFSVGHALPGGSATFSLDGTMVATEGHDRAARLWDLRSGKQQAAFTLPMGSSRCLALSPDSRFLASCYKGIRVWEVASGKEIRRFDVPFPDAVHSVAFSLDSRTLFTGMEDSTVLVWDLVPPATAFGLPQRGSDTRELEGLRHALAGEDGAKVYAAVCALVAVPRQAVPFLQARLQPVSPVEPRRLERLIAELDSDVFRIRQEATAALDQLGVLAEGALRRALGGKPSLETRQRVEQLLSRPVGPIASPTRLRSLRAIQVLERIGSQEARQVLAALAGGVPEARETREAKASLDRLAQRPVAKP
jgi:hypothetical protein